MLCMHDKTALAYRHSGVDGNRHMRPPGKANPAAQREPWMDATTVRRHDRHWPRPRFRTGKWEERARSPGAGEDGKYLWNQRFRFPQRDLRNALDIRLLFSYTLCMFNIPDSRICDYAVCCKGCDENIPAPVETMPDTWIVTGCPLCGSKFRYLPTDIFRGRLSHRLSIHLVTRSAAHG